MIHGSGHAVEVALIGLDLARETGADPAVVVAFAILHDSMRTDDENDGGEHARGAASLADGIERLSSFQREQLERAIYFHADGFMDEDATIGTCWDADRLTLGRVGIKPAPWLMSTRAGRERAQR